MRCCSDSASGTARCDGRRVARTRSSPDDEEERVLWVVLPVDCASKLQVPGVMHKWLQPFRPKNSGIDATSHAGEPSVRFAKEADPAGMTEASCIHQAGPSPPRIGWELVLMIVSQAAKSALPMCQVDDTLQVSQVVLHCQRSDTQASSQKARVESRIAFQREQTGAMHRIHHLDSRAVSLDAVLYPERTEVLLMLPKLGQQEGNISKEVFPDGVRCPRH